MIKQLISLYIILSIPTIQNSLFGQGYNQHKTDSIISKAMKDELFRNLNNLLDKDAGKPFFISYTYLNGEISQASAILGILKNSYQTKLSTWDIRLMMGNYNLNDENFEDSFSNDNVRTTHLTWQTPIEPDYMGIRNAFWWNTSDLFRQAAKTYLNKLAALKDKPLADSSEILPDYTKADPKNLFDSGSIVHIDLKRIESLVKEVSLVFKDFKDVYLSGASAQVFSSTIYIENTEGSEIRIPLNSVALNISANVYGDNGEIFSNSISYICPVFSGLPPVDTIKKDSKILAEYLLNLRKAKIVNENYTGPVLFYNDGVAKVFANGLFGYDNPLIADRDPLVNSLSKSMTPKHKTSNESKLGKKIISKNITVTDLPHLKEYNNIPLWGSYDVDAECIFPPDKLPLIDKGILKNMLNDRVPTKNFSQSNGHYRFGIGYGGFTKEIMPGVVRVESDNTMTDAGLKDKMLKIAKDDGLDYVIVVKPLITGSCHSPLCFYKLDVNTKKEELIYNMSVSNINTKTLKKIAGCGTGTFVMNIMQTKGSYASRSGLKGYHTSYIVPNAMLIEEMDLTPKYPYPGADLPFYANPDEGATGEEE